MSAAERQEWRGGAFVDGDAARRGPLAEGLPTVEEHLPMPPLSQALALLDAGADGMYAGDTVHS